MVIFGDISEAIECPTGSSGGGGGGGDLPFDTLESSSDTTVDLGSSGGGGGAWVGQLVTSTGEQITSVTVNGMDNGAGTDGTIKSQIWTNAVTDIDSSTFVANSSNTLNFNFPNGTKIPELQVSNLNFTWTYSPPVTVNDPDTFVAIRLENWDTDVFLKASTTNIGSGNIWVHDQVTSSGFFQTIGVEDMLMKVTVIDGGGEGVVGSEQCQQAKDISWTVIGIIPVALFFSLFAIFSALGTGGRQ